MASIYISFVGWENSGYSTAEVVFNTDYTPNERFSVSLQYETSGHYETTNDDEYLMEVVSVLADGVELDPSLYSTSITSSSLVVTYLGSGSQSPEVIRGWVTHIPYVRVNGAWVRAIPYSHNGTAFARGTLKVYSVEGNDQETTMVINSYTTEPNEYGTTVIIG